MNAEIRTTVDRLLEDLKARLAAPGTSLLPLLTTMSRFAKYSLANQFLIFAQRPDARCVMGYRAWQKVGYQVKKGEHGIAIYAPLRFAQRNADSPSTGTSPQAVSTQGLGACAERQHTEVLTGAQRSRSGALRRRASSQRSVPGVPADGAPAEGSAIRVGFRVTYVFDINQVDALPGTDAMLLTQPTPADSPDAHRANEQLKAFLVGHNVELEYKALAPGLLGYTNGRRITCGQGQASHVEFATLAHETTHVLLHFPTDGRPRPDLVTRETEAEAVTYLLCAQLGIAGTDASVDYIRSYRGSPDTLEASLARIRDTAQRLVIELAAIRFDVQPDPGPA